MTMEDSNSIQFEGWLKGVVREFHNLTSVQQTKTLNQLITCCGSEQLWHLQQKLPDFLYRDFIQLLPPEITEKILKHLSPATLLKACRVSKLWNKTISEMQQLWKKQCIMVGCNLTAPSDLDFKLRCVQGLQLKQQLSEGRAWEQESLINLVRPPGRFSALHHHNGYIAGGTSDSSHTAAAAAIADSIEDNGGESVVIWSVATNRVTVSFPVSGSLSCIKLDYPSMVVCGHFDGTLSSHQVSGVLETAAPSAGSVLTPLAASGGAIAAPGRLLHKFRLHTAPVLALDFSIEEDILVSGSADCATKIWRLSTGELVKTLASQSHWVLSVIFTSKNDHTVANLSGRHTLLIMTRDDIQLFSWIPDRNKEDEERGEDIENPQAAAKDGQTLKEMSYRDLYIPLKSVTDAVQSFFFTPGLHFDGRRISFVRQMPMFDTQTIGDADIVTIDAGSGKVIQSVHVNQKIRKLLAIGNKFAVILLPYVDTKYKNLAIVDLTNREVIGGCTVPHSRASTPDFSQVSIGDKSWLDGFSDTSTRGLICCLALTDSTIQTVVWRNNHLEKDMAKLAVESRPSLHRPCLRW